MPNGNRPSRRQFIRAGIAGIASLSLADVLALRACAAQGEQTPRDTSVILIL